MGDGKKRNYVGIVDPSDENGLEVDDNGNIKVRLVDSNNNPQGNNVFPIAVRNIDSSGSDVNRLSDEDNYLSEFLLNGGSEDMAVDGLSPAVEFSYTIPVDTKVKLTRGFITIEDGNTEFTPGNFGQIAGALANGVEISITPDGGTKVVLETWTTNREMRNTMFDFDNEFKQSGAYIGRWTFGKDLANSGFSLAAGDKFSFLIQDNLSVLDFMSFRLKGNIENV